MRPPVVSFEFDKPFRTIKKPKKKQPAAVGKKDDDEPEDKAPKDVSLEDPDATGKYAGGDFEGAEDETDDSAIYANKFDCFTQMLELLVAKHGCQISSNLRKLKRKGRSKKHVLSTTGEARCLFDVTIEKDGDIYHALELDMSDEGKYLSTMLLKLPTERDWPEQIDILESELQRLSLRWPSKTLRKFCGRGNFHGVPHPETKANHKGKLDPASVEHWAERFFSWISA